jgi:hypothetical protein
MDKIEAKRLWNEAGANIKRLDACAKHRFSGSVTFGGKLTCELCGGTMGNTDAIQYARGFAAAGGTPTDIHPSFDFIKPAGSPQ